MKPLLLLILFFCSWSHADVSVIFFQIQDGQDRVVQLEEGGDFFHVALQLEDGTWIHSHPKRGVEIITNPVLLSKNFVILTHPDWPSIRRDSVKKFLGLPFDFTYDWVDQKSTYCSKLVGELLDIKPLPMSFRSEHWKYSRTQVSNGMGLSPDDLYSILKNSGFLEITISGTCQSLLTKNYK